jgi:hypothetical protein
MPEFVQIISGLLFLMVVYILTRIGVARRIRHTAIRIIQDLERREAFDPNSAVELPFAKANRLRIGLRDYRPKALESLVQGHIVGRTQDGKCYLVERQNLDR